MIKAVLFDLDGTLLDRATSLLRFIELQYCRFEALQHIGLENYMRSFIQLDKNGHVWKDEVYRQLIEQYKIEGVMWQDLLTDYVNSFADACIGFAGLREMLVALKEGGYVLGMVTNGRSPFQERNIQALGIESFFSEIIVSEAVGLRKPDAAIFNLALNRISAEANEAVFVGDSPASDIQGAQNAGMKAIWKYSDYWQTCAEADAVCHELIALPGIIHQL